MGVFEIVGAVFMFVGCVFALTGSVGVLRMPDFFTSMHAASVTDTLGAGLVLAGLMLQAGLTLVTAKLAIIVLLIFFTSPAATHALAKAALVRGVKPLLADEEKGEAPSKP